MNNRVNNRNLDWSECPLCGDDVSTERIRLGYVLCMCCGEDAAKQVKHTIVPMNKSNYILVTDLSLLKQLNPKNTVPLDWKQRGRDLENFDMHTKGA
jgi:hypothetical protein